MAAGTGTLINRMTSGTIAMSYLRCSHALLLLLHMLTCFYDLACPRFSLPRELSSFLRASTCLQSSLLSSFFQKPKESLWKRLKKVSRIVLMHARAWGTTSRILNPSSFCFFVPVSFLLSISPRFCSSLCLFSFVLYSYKDVALPKATSTWTHMKSTTQITVHTSRTGRSSSSIRATRALSSSRALSTSPFPLFLFLSFFSLPALYRFAWLASNISICPFGYVDNRLSSRMT